MAHNPNRHCRSRHIQRTISCARHQSSWPTPQALRRCNCLDICRRVHASGYRQSRQSPESVIDSRLSRRCSNPHCASQASRTFVSCPRWGSEFEDPAAIARKKLKECSQTIQVNLPVRRQLKQNTTELGAEHIHSVEKALQTVFRIVQLLHVGQKPLPFTAKWKWRGVVSRQADRLVFAGSL